MTQGGTSYVLVATATRADDVRGGVVGDPGQIGRNRRSAERETARSGPACVNRPPACRSVRCGRIRSAPAGPPTIPACDQYDNKQGGRHGGDLERRVLLREVQGEAGGGRRGQGQRQGHPHGQGRVPRLWHEPEPHSRQGLSARALRTSPRRDPSSEGSRRGVLGPLTIPDASTARSATGQDGPLWTAGRERRTAAAG